MDADIMYSKAPDAAAVLGKRAGSRTARPLYKMVIDTADWHLARRVHNKKL
jgi:hypothetical protein